MAESTVALPPVTHRRRECADRLIYNVSKNGLSGDWYWEVITPERDIMARGLATTSTQARADAVFGRGGGHNPTARPVPIQRVARAAAGVRVKRRLKPTDNKLHENQETGFLGTFDPDVPGYVFWLVMQPLLVGGHFPLRCGHRPAARSHKIMTRDFECYEVLASCRAPRTI